MAILESVKELASKLGAETNGRDITDQLNKINKHLDETALSGRDIAEAVKTYSKNASGGGGGGETFEVNVTYTNSTTYSSDKTYSEIETAVNSGKNVKCKFTWIMNEETVVLNSYGMIKQEVYEAELERPVHYFTFALEQFMYAQGPAFPSFAISDFNGMGFLSIKVSDALNPV